MKVTKQALQRIIREAVQSKLRELDEAPEASEENATINDTLEVIASAIAQEVGEHLQGDVAFSNIGEVTAGSLDMDNAFLPARLEDVEAFAAKITALALDYVRDDVEKIASEMLETLITQTTT